MTVSQNFENQTRLSNYPMPLINFGMAHVKTVESKINIFLVPDSNKNLPIHNADMLEAKDIIKIFQENDKHTELKQMLLTKNKGGCLPVHRADAEKTKLIIDALGDDKEAIKEMLLTKNDSGSLPVETFCDEKKLYLSTVAKDLIANSDLSNKDSLELLDKYARYLQNEEDFHVAYVRKQLETNIKNGEK